MVDEVKADRPEEERPIGPYYKARAREFVSILFDLALLSDSLSRDGMNRIDDLLALMFQQTADSAARCASFTKRYKILGGRAENDAENEDRQRHKSETAWIARAQEAENDVIVLADKIKKLTPWHKDVVKFLRDTLATINYCVDVGFASHLLNKAFELGLAEPDFGPADQESDSEE